MRKNYNTLSFLFLILQCTYCYSQQIPNSGFENWHVASSTGRMVPDNWTTSDSVYSTASVVQVQGYTGNYAVRLNKMGPSLTLDGGFMEVTGGPIADRPYWIMGSWRDHTGNTTDQGSACLYIYDSLGNVGSNCIQTPFLQEIPNYEPFNLLVAQGSLTTPPYTFVLRFSVEAINVGSYVDIDDLSMLVTGVEGVNSLVSNFSISYTHVEGEFNIQYFMFKTSPISIEIYDVTGNKVSQVYSSTSTFGNHTIRCNLENLSPGIYLCKMDTDLGSKTLKFIYN